MKNFSKPELKAIGIILGILAVVSFFNFRISLRRARDAQRMSDIGQIADNLNVYKERVGSFPVSQNGKLLACLGSDTTIDLKTGAYVNLLACNWDSESLIGKLPIDPNSDAGWAYLYISDGWTYQIYANLEGKDEPDYKQVIIKRNLNCGTKICNAGKAYSRTPLDKSIEEYENELKAKQ